MGLHPYHAQIAETIRDWFHLPFDSMGYYAEPRRWGTYWNNVQVYTSALPLDQVDAFLADVREYFAGQPTEVIIHTDDRAADAELGLALCAAGCVPGVPELFLAHVGASPSPRAVPGLELQPVDEAIPRISG